MHHLPRCPTSNQTVPLEMPLASSLDDIEGKKLTEEVLIEALKTQHIATAFHAVLGEQLRPRLQHGDHTPLLAFDLALGLLEDLIMHSHGVLKRLFLVYIGGGHEYVA